MANGVEFALLEVRLVLRLSTALGIASEAGLGVLQTLLYSRDHGVYLGDLHLARLANSCGDFGFPIPSREEIHEVVRRAAGASGLRHARVRLVLDKDGSLHVTCAPISVKPTFPMPDPTASPLRVKLDSQPVRSDDMMLRHKTTARTVYDEARRRAGCGGDRIFDALLYNEREEITEACIANVAVVDADSAAWRTPPVACGLLPGVMREALMATGRLRECVITVQELAGLTDTAHVVCFNSVRGVYRVELVFGSADGPER